MAGSPPFHLLSTSSPAMPVSTTTSPISPHSNSPFRYIHFDQSINEKDTPLDDLAHSPSAPGPSSARVHPSRPSPSSLAPPSPGRPTRPTPLLIPEHRQRHHRNNSYKRPRGLRICNLIKSWAPVIAYAATSIGFLVAIAFYKTEVFARLDELSQWLRADPLYGHAVLFVLIFLTTFPPIPLYSTLIILSGYTFGPWTGAVISYFAALTGALTVFLISRSILRDSISRWLDTTCTMKRVVRAIEKRPKLLFLIRLAPYPYNVMNCLLAASPSLTLRTYTVCTALSLFKVIIHTSLGASIHSFKDYHVVPKPDPVTGGPGNKKPESSESGADTVARMWTGLGIALCIAILVYLSYVARKAVDEELDEEPGRVRARDDDEETIAFLSPRGSGDLELGTEHEHTQEMVESPFRSHQSLPISRSASPSVELNPSRQGYGRSLHSSSG